MRIDATAIARAKRRSRRQVLVGGSALLLAGCGASDSNATDTETGEIDLDLNAYALTFDENFSSLDISPWGPGTRWIAHTPWDGDFGDAAFADPEPGFPFTTSNGGLRIEARQEADGTWRSGLICSLNADGDDHDDGPGVDGATTGGFGQAYGYFEMRAKLPDGPGVWPAFWLVSAGDYPRAEIDVLEYYGRDRRGYESVVHLWKADAPDFAAGTRVSVERGSLTVRYNDFGVAIGPEHTVFYLNKREVWRTETIPEFRQPMYMLANLALGGGWPINRLESPLYMHIAHIRAYALKG